MSRAREQHVNAMAVERAARTILGMRALKSFTVGLLVVAACGQPEPAPRPPGHVSAATDEAVAAIRAARFADALQTADRALAAEPRDARAAAVRAVARYQRAGEGVMREIGKAIDEADGLKFFDHERGRKAWLAFLGELEAVDRDLEIAAQDPAFSLELSLAEWKYDWNGNGVVDERDRKMFELEYDGRGGALEDGDPRRRPVYRFDAGDVYWGRAMIAFQRAGVELVLAYRWSELDALFTRGQRSLTIHLVDPGRVKRAHDLVLAGLGFSGQERAAYLAETDDDREWVPSPRQRSYAMPLAVDVELYAGWAAILGDARNLLASRDGISMREVARLIELDDEDIARVPDAFVDLGRMFEEPKDIVIDLSKKEPDALFWRGLLGNGYRDSMHPSPLVARLRGMKDELSRGEDTIEKKLRYLLWLN
jgi:hypothetical protein